MHGLGSMDRERILEVWLDRLETRRWLLGPREAVRAELSHWLALLAEPDRASRHELHKLAAFHARQLGVDGRPASAAIGQVLELGRVLESHDSELLEIVADAHALGAEERARAAHEQVLRDRAPLVRLGGGRILGFLIGPMSPDLMDAMLGRLLREAAMVEATHAILDLGSAEEDDDRLHRTLDGFLRTKVGQRLHLVILGARDAAKTRAALAAVGADVARVSFFDHLHDYLEG